MTPLSSDKVYVVVRSDLSPAQQAVQGMHALADLAVNYPGPFRYWNRGPNKLVMLRVKDERELRETHQALFTVKSTLFLEPDMDWEAAFAVIPSDIAEAMLWHLPLALPKRRLFRRRR